MLIDREITPAARFLPKTDSPRVYDTRLHTLPAAAITRAKKENVEAEQSFIAGRDVTYGEDGSLRTDVVLRNKKGQVTAVWDFTTTVKSKADMPASRVAALQRAVKSEYGEVPVFIIHIRLFPRLSLP